MKLYDFQEAVLEKTSGRNKVAYFLEMGLGKTFVGFEKLMELNSKINLIICQKSKVYDWYYHAFVYRKFGFFVHDLTKRDQLDGFMENCSSGKDCNYIGIINYDLLRVRPEILKLSGFTLMLDESSLINNENALKTKIIMRMNYENVILLSGTPVSGRYEKLFSQMKLLGMAETKSKFWKEYINYILWEPAPGVYPIKLVTGYKNVPKLKDQLKQLGAVFMKSEEALTLPEQVFTPIKVPVSKHYRKFIKDSIVEVDGSELVGDTTLTKLLYSRMLCSAYSKEKLTAFLDWIDSTEGRLIVFYNFNSELEKLRKLCAGRITSVVNGTTKDLCGYESCDDSITFVQYQAGAMGLNLQKANHIGYFSPPLSSALFEQSKKRIHRIGQKGTCFYYMFTCGNSVEEHIYMALNKQQDYTEKLFEKRDY